MSDSNIEYMYGSRGQLVPYSGMLKSLREEVHSAAERRKTTGADGTVEGIGLRATGNDCLAALQGLQQDDLRGGLPFRLRLQRTRRRRAIGLPPMGDAPAQHHRQYAYGMYTVPKPGIICRTLRLHRDLLGGCRVRMFCHIAP